jgi:hypothetical protein
MTADSRPSADLCTKAIEMRSDGLKQPFPRRSGCDTARGAGQQPYAETGLKIPDRLSFLTIMFRLKTHVCAKAKIMLPTVFGFMLSAPTSGGVGID